MPRTLPLPNNDNDNDDGNNDNTTMPPKAKPVTAAALKPAKKKAKKAEEIAHLPAPDIRTYSIEAGDPFTVSYYPSGKHDYAGVVFCVNGTMEYGEYKVQVAKDDRSILFVCAIGNHSIKRSSEKLWGSNTTRATHASSPGTIWCRRWRVRRFTPKMDCTGVNHR